MNIWHRLHDCYRMEVELFSTISFPFRKLSASAAHDGSIHTNSPLRDAGLFVLGLVDHDRFGTSA